MMKPKTVLSLAIVFGITLAWLLGSEALAQGPVRSRTVADTGIVALGPDQILRVSGDGVDQDDVVTVRVSRMEYAQDACSGGACRLTVLSQSTSAPIALAASQGVWVDIDRTPGAAAARVRVFSTSRRVHVNAMIVDKVTGQVVAGWKVEEGEE